MMASSSPEHAVFDNAILIFNDNCEFFANYGNGLKKLERWLQMEILQYKDKERLTQFISSVNKFTSIYSDDDIYKKSLNIFDLFVCMCSAEIYHDNAIKWIQNCLKNAAFGLYSHVVLKTLERLIYKSVEFPDLKKFVVTSVLPKFIGLLENYNNDTSTVTLFKLRCLFRFMKDYALSCGEYKGKILAYLWEIVKKGSDNKNSIRMVSRCFALLPQCGNGGQDGRTHQLAWTEQFNSLCSTLENLTSQLYSNLPNRHVQTIFKTLTSADPCAHFIRWLDEYLEHQAINRYFTLEKFHSLILEILRTMLLQGFPTSKIFDLSVMDFICSIIAVSSKTVSNLPDTEDKLAIMLVLPDVHKNALMFLDSLVQSAARNLIPRGDLICKICIQVLTESTVNFESCNFSTAMVSLRIYAYQTLTNWLVVSGSSSSCEIYASELVQIILTDTKYVEPVVQLSKESKKGRSRKPIVTHEDDGKNVTNRESEAFENICINAHIALQYFLISGTLFMKSDYYQMLQETTYGHFSHADIIKGSLLYSRPYNNSKCRLELFKSVKQFILEPHPLCPSSLSSSIWIFNKGINDLSDEIKGFCHSALGIIRCLIHPIGSTLNFPNINIGNSATVDTTSIDTSLNLLETCSNIINNEDITDLRVDENRVCSNTIADDNCNAVIYPESNIPTVKEISILTHDVNCNSYEENKTIDELSDLITNDVSIPISDNNNSKRKINIENDESISQKKQRISMIENTVIDNRRNIIQESITSEHEKSSHTEQDVDVTNMLNDFVDITNEEGDFESTE